MVQLPAINTPQFDWVRSNLELRARPVPPIFQPEVAADAMFWTAHQRRREVYVGRNHDEGDRGNKIAPHLLDGIWPRPIIRLSRPTSRKIPTRRDNLYEAVPGDYEAHGRFDGQALRTSAGLWMAKHKYKLGLGLLAAGLSGLAGSIAYSRNRRAA